MLSTNRFDKLPSQVHTPFKNIFVGNCKTVTTNHTVCGCRILTKTLEKKKEQQFENKEDQNRPKYVNSFLNYDSQVRSSTRFGSLTVFHFSFLSIVSISLSR